MSTFVVSSGHGLYVSGATKYLNEVNEARKVTNKVTDLLNKVGATAYAFHDNTSRNQDNNLRTIVNFHNSKVRDIDVSIHFNAGGGTGVEVLYYDAVDLAKKVSASISKASGLKDRGAKKRTDLYFLRQTKRAAILIEVCFVDSTADAAVYEKQFHQICEAIVEALTGKKVSGSIDPAPPTQAKPVQATGKRVEALVNDLRFYSKPSWLDKDVAGKMKKGEGFTFIEKLKVGSAEQYKVKNSKGVIFYVTASTNYVKLV